MPFKITPKEKDEILFRRAAPITADSDDAYYDLVADMRTQLNEFMDGIRAFENYFEYKDALRQAVEKDFDRMEKLGYEMKGIIKKLNKKKVVRK